MLVADAAAPVAGAVFAQFVAPSETFLMLYLGFFAGFLLYIGAADVLPQAHLGGSPKRSIALIILTCAGTAFAFAAATLTSRA
jgi:ZIP family zinc transporter